MVVDEEDGEEDGAHPPHYEHFFPVESLGADTCRTDVHAHHRCHEEQSP